MGKKKVAGKGAKKAKKKAKKKTKPKKARQPARRRAGKPVEPAPAGRKGAPASAATPPDAAEIAPPAEPPAGPLPAAAVAASQVLPFKALAVDIGASNGRAVLGTLTPDDRLLTKEVRRFPNGAEDVAGSLRWDFDRLAAEVEDAVDDCLAAGESPSSVAVDTWGVDYALIGEDGRLIDRPFGYRDHRTDGMMQRFFAEVMPRERVYGITGIQFMEINTLFQVYVDTLKDPDRLRRGRKLLMMPDALAYSLVRSSGAEPVGEYTIATTSQMLDARTRTWSDELVAALSLPPQLLPRIVEPGTKAGGYESVSNGRSAKLDVVLAAGHDTAAAVAAVPAKGDEPWAYVSSGTWTLVGVETTEPVVTDAAREAGVTNEGGVEGTYRLLTNIMGLWLLQESMRKWEEAGSPQGIEKVCDEAADSPRGGALVDPDADRFRSPEDMTAEIDGFCRETGQAPPEGAGAVARAIFESLALKTRVVVERIAALTGTDARIIHMVGGGSRNRLLCQMTADACGRPVVAGPAEGTAAGNLLIQARAAGRLDSLAEIREVVRNSFDLERYEPSDEDYWRGRYERFTGLLG